RITVQKHDRVTSTDFHIRHPATVDRHAMFAGGFRGAHVVLQSGRGDASAGQQWPYLHTPVCRARTPGGPVHGVIEVAALQHERAADLFTRLVERSIADHAPAVTNLDGPGHRRRAEPRSVLQDSSLRGLL